MTESYTLATCLEGKLAQRRQGAEKEIRDDRRIAEKRRKGLSILVTLAPTLRTSATLRFGSLFLSPLRLGAFA